MRFATNVLYRRLSLLIHCSAVDESDQKTVPFYGHVVLGLDSIGDSDGHHCSLQLQTGYAELFDGRDSCL